MIKKVSLLAAAALLSIGSAHAGNEVGLYFTPSATINTGPSGSPVEVKGDGFGLVGKFDVFGPAFVTAEYSDVTYDDQTVTDIDLTQIRIGFGAKFNLPISSLSAIAHAEIINLDFQVGNSDDSEVGGGVHAGIAFEPNDAFNVFAKVGYIDVDDLDGSEVKLGVNVNAGSRVTIFSDYRVSNLEDGDDDKVELDDFHIGAAFKF